MGEEGVRLVQELLNEFLEDICTPSEWDVANKGRTLDAGTKAPNLIGPRFDLCELVRREYPSLVLTNYCLADGAVEVLHMKCVKQHASGYCGHYAVYFALCCLEACFSTSVTETVGYLGQINSVAAYWRRYWMSVAELLKRVKNGGGDLWWPWTSEHVLAGDMERSYFAHLLKADPHLLSLGGNGNILVLHFAYGCIQNTAVETYEIQGRMYHFRSAPSPASLVLVMGVTNHWVTMLASRTLRDVAAKGPRETHGLVYLDSNNVPLLTATNSEIVKLVEKKEGERIQRKGRGYSEWKRGVIYQALVDQRDVVQLLAGVLYGSKNICSEWLMSRWTLLLDSYSQHVVLPLADSQDRGLRTALLVQWLENHCRPQTLRDTHLSGLKYLGVHHLHANMRARVKNWVHHCQESCDPGIDIIDLFLAVLREVHAFLNSQ